MTENSFKMAIRIAQSNQQDENAHLSTKTVSTKDYILWSVNDKKFQQNQLLQDFNLYYSKILMSKLHKVKNSKMIDLA